MCFFPFSIHIFSIFQMVCACSRALSLHFPKIHPHYIHIGVCSCQAATLHLPIRRWVSPTLVSVWVCLGVKLPLRQVLLASWLEQVYRRRSHRTELCTWLWTRHWRVKPLPPSLPLVFFFLVSVSLSLPVSLYSLFACSHSPSHSALERLRLHGYLHPLPSGRFCVLVGRHRWHTHK